MIKQQRWEWFERNHSYQLVKWDSFDYSILSYITYTKRRGRGPRGEVNDSWIMADTETSKKTRNKENHIVAWSISIRYGHMNIVTLWGSRPSEFCDCLNELKKNMRGDLMIYWHNMAYDYTFLRKFLFMSYGTPASQLNIKSHYPIIIKWPGFTFKDSLILLQRKLEKAGEDYDVVHKKAVGFWDYDGIRNQDDPISEQELTYITNDTLCGVEVLDALATSLNKDVLTIPFTSTGIVRDRVRRVGKHYRAHDLFLRCAPPLEVYLFLESIFHGGYTHGNRYYYDVTVRGLIEAYDFKSSYPFVMLVCKFPMGQFDSFRDCDPQELLRICGDKYAAIFTLTLFDVELKEWSIPMPALQGSKASNIINPIIDNGRIMQAEVVQINLNEVDLDIIVNQYKWSYAKCTNVKVCLKDYLPRWYRDLVFDLFKQKESIDKKKDPINYQIIKGMLNSLYGNLVMKNIKEEIMEDYETGDYYISDEKDPAELYAAYCKRRTSILPYQWGCWVTSYSMHNLFELGSFCETWLYSDTDSCYGMNWDRDKINSYNDNCLRMLKAQGYGAVKGSVLGAAELDGTYKEFRTVGAKRYIVRDMDDKIKITVAGVPKKTGSKCITDLDKFTTGFIFPGKKTGKLTHEYIYKDDIYIDENGNETGDSINLEPCDYLLKAEDKYDYEDEYEEGITAYTDGEYVH